MAGAIKVRTVIKCTGLGDSVTIDTGDITHALTPIEHGGSGIYITHATAGTTAIQVTDLFPQIAAGKMFMIYLECVSGTLEVMLDTAGTATFDNTTSHLTINEGLGLPIPVNPDNNAGVKIDAASTDDAFVISAYGEA